MMKELIRSGLEQLGLTPSIPAQAPEQLAQYGQALIEKNQVMNLTAITEPRDVATLHMLDCAAFAGVWPVFREGPLLTWGLERAFPAWR